MKNSPATNTSEYIIRNFTKGVITRVEDFSIPDGAASDSLNWMTLGDRIELRRGRTLMGADGGDTGRISGLVVAERFDGEQVAFRTRVEKIEYYDTDSELWVESTVADILPTAASGEDFSFSKYHSLAGAFVYGSSKNSGIYKIPIANPDSVVDLSSTDFRGKIRIKQSRMFLWDRKDTNGGFDQTGLYGSKIDKDELSDYTEIIAEALDVSGPVTWTGTLDFKSGQPKRTCMYVSITGTVGGSPEVFRDDRSGNLVSNLGSTGTINYATGAYSVTFSAAATVPTATYYWEDSTVGGIADFAKATPRIAGEGFVLRQDDGGSDMQALCSINDTEFCLHTRKTWALKLTSDDTNATNDIYRDKVGIPYWRGACETGDGTYYMDAVDGSEPFVRILRPGEVNPAILPASISDNLILSNYRFDGVIVMEWGIYIVMACRTSDSTVNNRLFLFHKLWKTWDIFDYRCSTLDILNGTLIAGDSASQNVFTLFADLTDEDVEIDNFWISGQHSLTRGAGTGYGNIFRVKGLIQDDQEYNVQFSYDNAPFVTVGTISGQGDYVDHTQKVLVGSNTLGSNEVGGGSDGVEASPYEREFRVNTPICERVRVRFEATKVGYVSISEYGWKDIRKKSRRGAPQYVG